MEQDQDNQPPKYIPQIGLPEKESFQERNYTRAIYARATAPGFFGVIILCFFMSFINVKCGGQLVASYSGIDIITGVDKSNQDDGYRAIIGVRQSAYNQLQVAKEKFRIKEQQTADGNGEFLSNTEDLSYQEDFGKMPESFSEITTNPQKTRDLARIAFIAACVGLAFSFLKKKYGTMVQIIAGIAGFIAMMLIQVYVKVTIPKTSGTSPFINEYNTPIITTEFALGYWIALFLFLAVAVIGFIKLRWQKKISEVK